MFTAEIVFNDEILYKVLKPDIIDDKDVSITHNEEIKVIINAEKISDLRAKINSYLRLIDTAINSLNLE
jgi:tRNA threonylcarbamoyladenosine modification (KEOPS) complex  Pcc1 subunit